MAAEDYLPSGWEAEQFDTDPDPPGTYRYHIEFVKGKKTMKIVNKFYVASDRVTTEREQSNQPLNRWTKKTLAEAIKHAEELLEKEPHQEFKAIVQIIRIVRRKRAPIVVERVK